MQAILENAPASLAIQAKQPNALVLTGDWTPNPLSVVASITEGDCDSTVAAYAASLDNQWITVDPTDDDLREAVTVFMTETLEALKADPMKYIDLLSETDAGKRFWRCKGSWKETEQPRPQSAFIDHLQDVYRTMTDMQSGLGYPFRDLRRTWSAYDPDMRRKDGE